MANTSRQPFFSKTRDWKFVFLHCTSGNHIVQVDLTVASELWTSQVIWGKFEEIFRAKYVSVWLYK
jgi:hypothetical protein